MAECSGTKQIAILGLTSGWCANEAAARAWIYKEIGVQGRGHLHCDGACEDKGLQCKLAVVVPKDIEIECVEDIFNSESGHFVQGYRATFEGNVTVKCVCAPKKAWF